MVTSYDQSAASFTPIHYDEMAGPSSAAAAAAEAAPDSGMGLAMQTAALQPYAVEQVPPQVLISGVDTAITPQDGLDLF